MRAESTQRRLVYYGDDFTGSTDALDLLARGGINTVLFMELPDESDLQAFPEAEAIGFAGTTRSMDPDRMENELQPALALARRINPRHFHYKVCSTFDSSPSLGSIGRAMDTIFTAFPSRFIPILVGIPDLGRYVVFGNLFARLGTGADGEIFRIDRHPSMRHHPATPATESDLRKVLAQQTTRDTALFDIHHARLHAEEAPAFLESLLTGLSSPAVLFDTLSEEDLAIPGALMETESSRVTPLPSVGSSAVEQALLKAWGKTVDPIPAKVPEASNLPLLVLSGSCSPVTTRQIQEAVQGGFAEVPLNIRLVSEGGADAAVADAVETARVHLLEGRNTIVHTYGGAPEARERIEFPDSAEVLGSALGKIGLMTAEDNLCNRIVIAGGDTSGYAAKAMGIKAVVFSRPFHRGAPLCRVVSEGSPLNGKEINFKGGQVGSPRYFMDAAGLAQKEET